MRETCYFEKELKGLGIINLKEGRLREDMITLSCGRGLDEVYKS